MRLRRRPVWHALGSVAALLAGLLFATSAITARGTELRSSGRDRLTQLIADGQRRLALLEADAARLRAAVDRDTTAAEGGDARIAAARRAASLLDPPVGLSAVVGPGLTVVLDDAPRLAPGEQRAGNPTPDDLVVHEQDVLAVLNALWAGGADAVTVMGERIIATSTVRCVGNTLLLHGAVYSPPFVVAGIGDPDRMTRALDADRGVKVFRSYVEAYGLGYRVARRPEIAMPPYAAPVQLAHARISS